MVFGFFKKLFKAVVEVAVAIVKLMTNILVDIAQNFSDQPAGSPTATCPPETTCPPEEKGDLGIEVKEKTNGAPVEGATVSVSGPEDHTGRTDATGVALFSGLTPGTYSVEAEREGFTKDPGTTNAGVSANTTSQAKVTLSPPKVVELVEVVTHKGKDSTQPPPAKERKQYINLDEKADPDNPHPEYDRCIKFKARVEWTSGDKSTSLKGASVYWYSKADPNNRAGLTGNELEGFDSKGSGMKNKITKTDEKGWTPVVKFYLSQYGGDKFDVYATEDKSYKGGKKAGPYTVWRKLYYDIVEMKTKDGTGKYDMPATIQNKFKSGYAKTFVEFEDTGKRHLGDYKDNFDTVEKGFKWADKYCSKTGVPQKVHLSVIDHAAPRSGTYGATKEKAEEEANTTPFTSSGKIRPYDFDGHNWLVKAQYWTNIAVPPAPVKMGWKDFAAGKVTLVGTGARRKFKVDFSGSGVTPSAASKIKVRIHYLQPGSYGGWGGSNCLHLLICRGEYEDLMARADADKQITVACLHEVGHALGLVASTAAWHAHNGHCKYNTCTMWFESSPGNEEFHDEATSDPGCRTFVRKKELTKSVLQSNWKFPR